MSKYILLTIDPNLLSYKALSGNMTCEIKACLNIDGVFKLFQIVVLANFHYKYSQKSKKKLLHFILFCFEENGHGLMSVMTLCILYFNIMGFMKSKLK